MAWSPDREVTVMRYLMTTVADAAADAGHRSAQIRAEKQPGKWNFGFVGRLDASKVIEMIIEASRRKSCADINWHFFGDGPEAHKIGVVGGANLYWHGPFDRSTPLGPVNTSSFIVGLRL